MNAAHWAVLVLVLVLAAIAWRALDDWRDRRRAARPNPRRNRGPMTNSRAADGWSAHDRLGIEPLNWD
jgi:peptidoglycan/LPS O-acetylase OafA/YrhL